jgi:hypothetical protein
MSADNGTYILKTLGKDGPEFRIIHCQAIENIYGQYISSTSSWLPNPKNIVDYFETSTVYTNLEEAWDEAFKLDESYDWSEDGVCLITTFEQYYFSDFVDQAASA